MPLSDADLLFQASLVHHQAGRFDDAIAGYQKVLELAPGHAPAKAMLVSLASREPKRLTPAPANEDEFLNEGTELAQSRRFDRAIAEFRKGLALAPDRVDLLLALADALLKQIGQDDNDALAELDVQPDSIDALNRFGKNLPRHGAMQAEAVTLCRRVIELAPDVARAHAILGDALWLKESTAPETADAFRRASALDPGNNIYRYRVALLTGEPLDTLSPEIVVELFDTHAGTFDSELASLQYKVPQRLRDAVGQPHGRVADLGCGTGLCGPLFHDGSSHLIGVDLSSAMLALARTRDAYDELRQADLHEFLAGEQGSLDLILAADVLIYVGNLDRLFPLAAAALVPGGRLAFSTEKGMSEHPYRFLSTGRFQHRESYIRTLAATSGLAVDKCQEIPIRLSGTGPIPGQLFVLRRP